MDPTEAGLAILGVVGVAMLAYIGVDIFCSYGMSCKIDWCLSGRIARQHEKFSVLR